MVQSLLLKRYHPEFTRAVEITYNVILDQVQAIYFDIRSGADHFSDLNTIQRSRSFQYIPAEIVEGWRAESDLISREDQDKKFILDNLVKDHVSVIYIQYKASCFVVRYQDESSRPQFHYYIVHTCRSRCHQSSHICST